MVDQEVVEILTEIKRRVSAAQEESISESSIKTPAPAGRSGYASLPVLARAWDRLPPLLSNRTGMPARLELWIKGKVKRAFRWFTWEQVNFNGAAYQTFVDLIESLNAYERQLLATRQQIESLTARLLAESLLREEKLLDEQRVCYRQLALELSESRVLQDRALRELAERLAKLEKQK